jgi:PmbA protein
MITEQQKTTAQWALDFALHNGCQQARISLINSSNTSYEVRDMRLDNLQLASESGLSIQLFVDGRFGSFSTNRTNVDELKSLILNGIAATRFLAIDNARTLPDNALYYKGGKPDLQLCDYSAININADQKIRLAMQLCNEITGQHSRVVSATTSYCDGFNFSYHLASNGFEGLTANSFFSLSAEANIKGDNDARPAYGRYEPAIHFKHLPANGLGTDALQRALAKLGQKKIASARMTMIVDNFSSAQLLAPVINALNGQALQQKNSFLLDKTGQKIFSDKMCLNDEPHIPQTFGARYFDNEGVATKFMSIFDHGTLNTYFLDTYYARKMQTTQTISSPSHLVLTPGHNDAKTMIKATDKGIFITGFNGGNCNPVTGDFSYGIEGFLIENGQLSHPVAEMNITGNMLQLWNNLADVGNDARPNTHRSIPTLMFYNTDFSGI